MGTHTEEPVQLRITVVIPVFNGGPDLEQCLAAISTSSYPVFECILVDDASTDGMVSPVAERYGARVIRLDQQHGPARARNLGVREARGDIIFFTDADVLLHPDALATAVKTLQADPEISAVFGSYDDQPAHASFISQYRNLFHHWVHQTGAAEASTFWTGCGAIRRDVFMEIGGFSQDYRRPSIEDIELGARLRNSGHRIRMLKDMLGKHMKQWKFWNMVHTDIFMRGVPWMLLVLREGSVSSDLNLNYKSRAATVLAGLLGLSALILVLTEHAMATLPTVIFLLSAVFAARLSGPLGKDNGKTSFAIALVIFTPAACYWFLPDPLALVPLVLVLAMVATHLSFYRYVAQKRSSAFAIAIVPLQVVFFLSCAVSIPIAFIRHYLGGRHVTDKKINP